MQDTNSPNNKYGDTMVMIVPKVRLPTNAHPDRPLVLTKLNVTRSILHQPSGQIFRKLLADPRHTVR